MAAYRLTNRQARRFVLLRQGLVGERAFAGKQGALGFVRRAGCIQFDPVDVCGRNAELTLQSRVEGFEKAMLDELLYADRLLVDYPDKQLAIIPAELWPYFGRYREAARKGGLAFEGLAAMEKKALAFIKANGPVSSAELPFSGSMRWHSSIHWSGGWDGETNAARAVLEQLYSAGRLVVHRKKGARKYYDLAERHLGPELLAAPEPLPDEPSHLRWRVLRRIGAVGLLWNRPSDAWLHIRGLNGETRAGIFGSLAAAGEIIPVEVEGIKGPLYCLAADGPLLRAAAEGPAPRPRTELIAPLDCLMWDRKLVKALFGFSYSWEIYTPAHRRKYAAYALPLLHGEAFAGRVEAVRNGAAKTLEVRNVWLEEGAKAGPKLRAALDSCLKRFAGFNGCERTDPRTPSEALR